MPVEEQVVETTVDDNKDAEQSEKWSKEKQRADQIEANYNKLVKERDAISSQLSQRDIKLATLEQRLEELASSQEVPVEDLLDPDLVDAKTIKTVSKMSKEIREQKKAIDKLTKLADTFKEKSQKEEALSEKEKTIEKILKSCDKRFGAKFRNSARKLADSLVDEGKEKQPQDIIEAMDLMESCYERVLKEAEEKEKKKVVLQTDSGSPSVVLDSSVPKAGSRRDILAGMRKSGLKLFGSGK